MVVLGSEVEKSVPNKANSLDVCPRQKGSVGHVDSM